MALLLSSCAPTGGGKSSALTGGVTNTGGTTTATAAPAPAPAPAAAAATVYVVTPTKVSVSSIYTKSSPGTSNCSDVTFTVTSNGQPAGSVPLTFSSATTSGAKDLGSVTPATLKTDSLGVAKTTFCSGDEAGKFVVIAKNGDTTVNSGEITVTVKPTYVLAFTKADITVHAGVAAASSTSTDSKDLGTVYLNLYDSGPNDCSFFHYSLQKSGAPLGGSVVRFTTQNDFPKGFKLATKAATGLTGVDVLTKHTYAYVDATSNTAGELVVPICAGQALGSVMVSATYVDPDGGTSATRSPVIVIKSGVTSWLDMTLTYALPDGHTLRGLLNTNSTDKHPFTVSLGSRNNGDAITDYSIFAAAETGKVELVDGGAITPGANTAHFTLNTLNLRDDRPYQTTVYPGSAANTVCDAEALASGPTDVPYPQLAKNWRSTLIYGVRGQEYFHDSYGDGKFHTGCTGFWDKNQNGIFDAGDQITSDPFNDGTLHTECDWFIDLPSPFVDVNENGAYDAGIDILIGDTYQAPNGKWDNDTIIWKYDYTPIYMGTSIYSILHSTVTHGNIASYADPLGNAYFTDLNTRGILGGYPAPPFQLWNTALNGATFGIAGTNEMSGSAYFYFFAHSVCGTPLPGDTSVGVTFTSFSDAAFGDRALTALFQIQPLDYIREPSRRLLSSDTIGSSSKINFDIVDHPAAAAGYPLVFKIDVAACTNVCTGDIATAGVGCDQKVVKGNLKVDTDTITIPISIPTAKTCSCAVGATYNKGACTCPTGQTNVGGTCQ